MKAKAIIAFCFIAAALCGVMATMAGAAAQSIVIVDGGGVYNLYQGPALEALQSVDDDVDYLGRTTLLPSVTEYAPTIRTTHLDALLDHDVALWFFENEQALGKISSGELERIAAAGKEGAVIGLFGDDDLLKSLMGAHDFQNDMEPDGNDYLAYLFDATEDGTREDNYTSFEPGATLGRGWAGIMSWVAGQLSGAAVPDECSAAENTYDPWNSAYNAKISNVGDEGDVAVTIAVFKLETTSETHDWYRVDMTVQASTYGYFKKAFEVGNYISSVDSELYATSGASHGELWEHAPATTQTSTKVSYSLGATLKGEVGKDPKTGADAEVGYSVSYDVHEVTIHDSSSHAQDKCQWSAKVKGPDWTWWPFSYGPSATAMTSYDYKPSTIWRVDKGEALSLYAEGVNWMADQLFYLGVTLSEIRSEAGICAVFDVQKDDD